MSFLYQVVIECDACGEQITPIKSTNELNKEQIRSAQSSQFMRSNVETESAIYDHVCDDCYKYFKDMGELS